MIGEEISLVVDTPGARGIWDVPTAIRRFRELEEFNLRWIEQPLPPADLAGHVRLREPRDDRLPVPAPGRRTSGAPMTYQRAIDRGAGAVDVVPARIRVDASGSPAASRGSSSGSRRRT